MAGSGCFDESVVFIDRWHAQCEKKGDKNDQQHVGLKTMKSESRKSAGHRNHKINKIRAFQ